MAVVDLKNNVVVIRIVYDGPPLAGKTTTVRALARSLVRRVDTPLQAEGRTMFFDWLEYTGGLFEGRQIRCQIVSVPGQLELTPRRRALLASADVVVFVADTSDAEAVARSVVAVRQLRDILREQNQSRQHEGGGGAAAGPVGVIVQANKRDVPTAMPRDELRAALGEDFAHTALTESVADAGTGIRETFVLAVRIALDRFRSGAGELLAGEASGAEQLLAELEALPIDSDYAPYVQAPPTVVQGAPRVPDARVPTGAIWPPVEGRMILHEACSGGLVAHAISETGDWAAGLGRAWQIHSIATAEYPTFEDGRVALLDWAQQHAAYRELVSPSRCVVLSESHGGRWRLWQIVKTDTSLRQWLLDAAEFDIDALYRRLVAAAAALGEVHARWSGTRLVPSLANVGMRGQWPQYVGLMPPTSAAIALASTVAEQHASVSAQLSELLQGELRERRSSLERAVVTMWKGVAPWDGVVTAALARAARVGAPAW
jgi:signal recognition particle receptor subunit beta